ncbi:acyltransferase family protein [Citrobacter amalonaticus]|nr:acyltransferase [Citrobacter amalonaticus]
MIKSIQSLRFLAALIVVIYHASIQFNITLDGGGYIDKLLKTRLAFGVDVFFVISGYVIYHSFMKKQKSAISFAIDRIKRIAPLYWFYTLVFAFILYLEQYLYPMSIPTLKNIALSMIFYPYVNEAGYRLPVHSVGWTLNYEMYFYAVFALCIAVFKRHALVPCIFFITLIYYVANKYNTLPYYQNNIVFEFIAGMIIASLRLERAKAWLPVILFPVAVYALGMAMGFGEEKTRLMLWGIPAAILVAFLVSVDKYLIPSKTMVMLGGASYSLYLCHRLVILGLFHFFGASNYSPELMVILSVFISIPISALSYLYLEPVLSRSAERIISFAKKSMRSVSTNQA